MRKKYIQQAEDKNLTHYSTEEIQTCSKFIFELYNFTNLFLVNIKFKSNSVIDILLDSIASDQLRLLTPL